MRQAWRDLWAALLDTLRLPGPTPRRDAALLFVALLAQLLYWHLGSPGPQLAQPPLPAPYPAPFLALATGRDLAAGGLNVGVSLLTLFLLPLAAWRLAGRPLADLGLRLGDWRFGLTVTLPLALVMGAAMFVSGDDPALKATYPWAGAWAGASLGNYASWAALYLGYYLAFEAFYRGFVLQLGARLWGTSGGVWLMTLASVLVHLGKPLAETASALPAAFLFAALALRGRSILWPLLLHVGVGFGTDLACLYYSGQLSL